MTLSTPLNCWTAVDLTKESTLYLLKDSCQGDQRKNILEFLAKIIEDYPKVAEMRSPECSFTEAVCFMCQHEACTGVGASQASRYEYQDTDTGNRKLDTFVEVGVYIIS